MPQEEPIAAALPAVPPVIRTRAEQTLVSTVGVIVHTVLSGADTQGRFSLLDYLSPAGSPGPALHRHDRTDETFYVVDGEMNFQVGDRQFVASAGTVVHVTPGTPHAFWNASAAATRMTIAFMPAGFDGYFMELFAMINARPDAATDIRPLVAQLESRYDVVTVGPPPALNARG
ncbi:MAG: qdoI [Phycisphaerales bacterium]|nr:qdoI [Phycisphaerales bacterium]